MIVLDHGSSSPIPESEVKVIGKEFKYCFIKDHLVSPVIAINNAVSESLGERLIVGHTQSIRYFNKADIEFMNARQTKRKRIHLGRLP